MNKVNELLILIGILLSIFFFGLTHVLYWLIEIIIITSILLVLLLFKLFEVKFDIINVRIWILFLLVFFVELNFILFYIFQNSHLNESLWNQIWVYLDSRPFTIVTVSVILPILLFLIENIFQFRNKIADERKQRQMKTIELTQEMWKNIIVLAGKVAHFNYEDDEKEFKIKEILQELELFAITGQDIVYQWKSEFPHLQRDIIAVLTKPIDVLLGSSRTVAYHILLADHDKNGYEKVNKLQKYLDIIESGLGDVNHETVVNVLSNFILIDWGEQIEKDKAIKENNEFAFMLRTWYDLFMQNEQKLNNFLPYVGSCEDENLVKFSKEYHNACIDNPNYKEDMSSIFNYIGNNGSFNDIRPRNERIDEYRIPYSEKYLEFLADHLYSLDVGTYLWTMAKWPKMTDYVGKNFSLEYPSYWQLSDKSGYELNLEDNGILCQIDIKNYDHDITLEKLRNDILSSYEGDGWEPKKILEPPLLEREFTIGLEVSKDPNNPQLPTPFYIFEKQILEPLYRETPFLRIQSFIKQLLKRKTFNVYHLYLYVDKDNYDVQKKLIIKTIASFELKRNYLFKSTDETEEKTISSYVNIANLAIENDDYNEAIKNYDKLLNYFDPEYVDAWNSRGLALKKLERYTEALESYDRALDIDPENAIIWNNKGVVLANLERYTEALESFDRALDIDPEYDHTMFNKGNVQEKLSRYSDAFESFKKVLEINPNHEDVLNRIDEIKALIKK